MVNVVKATGETETFSEEKLIQSIKRAGIPQELQPRVLSHVKEKIYDNIPTSEVYKHIIEFLGEASKYSQAKYSLKQAIMDFGPTGYPFEDYVAEMLTKKGYKTEIRQVLQGKCVSHEIDVVAETNGKKIMVEAKFHNASGIKTDVHVSLYTKARFDDLKEKHSFDEAWIITNTKISSDALAYALCENMKVISWSYPDGTSLRDIIEEENLHPITALTSLSTFQKQKLIDNHNVLCKDIYDNRDLLNLIELPADKRKNVFEEIEFVCKLK